MQTCVFCFAEFEDSVVAALENRTTCPTCSRADAFKPELETRLFKAQHAYRNPKNDIEKERAFGSMYENLRLYAWGKLVKKIGMIPMLDENIDDYSHDAAVKFLEHYLKDPKFVVEQSFGGYLGFKICDVLHNKKKRSFEEQNVLTNEAEVLGKTAFNARVRVDLGHDVVNGVVKIVRDACDACFEHRGRVSVLHLLLAVLAMLKSQAHYRAYLKTLDTELQGVIDRFCWTVLRDELRRNVE